MACGRATAATASGVPSRAARSGVRRLPIPKPASEAVAPATTETATMARRKSASLTPARSQAVERVLADRRRPRDELVLREPAVRERVAVADAVERGVHPVVRHPQQQRAARARVERPGGEEDP